MLRFTPPGGDVVETIARTGTSLDAAMEGQAVDVLYDPGDPRSAQIDSPSGAAGSALLPAGLMVIGGVCVLIGLVLLAGAVVIDA